jgi:hypothetical protein
MTCEECQARLLAGEVDDQVASHLGACAACRRGRSGLEALRQRLADPMLWEEPSSGLEDQVVAAVAAQRTPLGHRSSRRWWTVAAAAVAALAALALFASRAPNPDWRVTLAATAAAPQARASVDGWNTDTGTRMVLRVEGLTPLRDGSFYEVWLTAPDGRHISAGGFRGPGTVTVWAGVPRSEFPRIWVTIEPSDGDPAPSGVTVLDMAPEA